MMLVPKYMPVTNATAVPIDLFQSVEVLGEHQVGAARNIIITSIIVNTVNGCGCFYLLLWIYYATRCDFSKIQNL